MSPSNKVRRVVWPLGTRLASDLGRARQKYLSVPYGELAYVKYIILELGDNIHFYHVFWVRFLQTGLQCLFNGGSEIGLL
jgi:hypothetical protein